MRTVFVEADILGELSHLSCVDYIMQDPRIQAAVTNGLTKEDVLGTMSQVGFKDDGKAKPNHPGMITCHVRSLMQMYDFCLLQCHRFLVAGE